MTPSRLLAACLGVGGVCGLAWAAGLRGVMAELAGVESTVTWSGTFGWILLPGVAVGLLLGWAEYLRRTGGRRGWRWLALAPLLFAGVLMSDPGDLAQILVDGIGGGALAVPLFGMLGGFALSTRGPRWARVVSRAVLLAPIPGALVAIVLAGSVGEPRDALVAVSFYALILALGIGCAVPHRPIPRGLVGSAQGPDRSVGQRVAAWKAPENAP